MGAGQSSTFELFLRQKFKFLTEGDRDR